VTVVAGSRDQMTPAKAGAALAQALNASSFTLPCGHALMQEDPEGLRALLQARLRP
jgi:pimeloyl-ACP methyl ester carboxylesterase